MEITLIPNEHASRRTKNRISEHKRFTAILELGANNSVTGFMGRNCMAFQCLGHCDWRGWLPLDEMTISNEGDAD